MFGKTEVKDTVHIYSLYDESTEQYNLPSFYKTDMEALRALDLMFQDQRNSDILPVKYPEQFKMFRIGTYDKGSGKLEPINPKLLANLHEVVARLKADKLQKELADKNGNLN